MDPERREALVERRRRVHEDREHHRRGERRRSFQDELSRAGVRYEVVADEQAEAWIPSRFTVGDYSAIDWNDAIDVRQAGPGEEDPSTWLGKMTREQRLGNPVVVVVFADNDRPSLAVRLAEFAARAEAVIDIHHQTWVYDPGSDWLIEFHHDLGPRWGRSAPPGPTPCLPSPRAS